MAEPEISKKIHKVIEGQQVRDVLKALLIQLSLASHQAGMSVAQISEVLTDIRASMTKYPESVIEDLEVKDG